MNDPSDYVTILLAVSWSGTSIGLLVFLLRFLNNWKLVRRFSWDFGLVALTVTIQLSAQIILQLAINNGIGRHCHRHLSQQQQQQQQDHNNNGITDKTTTALKYATIFQLLAIASSVTGKLAIMAFLIQIRGLHERKPWFLWVLGLLLVVINAVDYGTLLGQCRPMRMLWDFRVQEIRKDDCESGRKVNEVYSFFQAGFNALSDAILAVYPIPLFWKLQMKLKVKIGLWFLMGLGWIAAICAAVKTYQIRGLMDIFDITYTISPLLIWGSTESWIIIIVSCIPTIRPIITHILQFLHIRTQNASSVLSPVTATVTATSARTKMHSRARSQSRRQNQRSSAFPKSFSGNLERPYVGAEDFSWVRLEGIVSLDGVDIDDERESGTETNMDMSMGTTVMEKDDESSKSESKDKNTGVAIDIGSEFTREGNGEHYGGRIGDGDQGLRRDESVERMV